MTIENGTPVMDGFGNFGWVVASGPDGSDGWLGYDKIWIGNQPDANDPDDVWMAETDDCVPLIGPAGSRPADFDTGREHGPQERWLKKLGRLMDEVSR
jgi:hypothetical protein